MNDARRRVERALASMDAADQLASAAESLLDSTEDKTRLEALREALRRYRAIAP